MRLPKACGSSARCHDPRTGAISTPTRTTSDQHSGHGSQANEEDESPYKPETSPHDSRSAARLLEARSENASESYHLPTALRPAGTYTGRRRTINVPNPETDLGEPMRFNSAIRKRIDSWINHLDSETWSEDPTMEEIPLTHDMPKLTHDMPRLTQVEQGQPKTWGGRVRVSPQIASLRGSNCMASSAGSGKRTENTVARSTPLGANREGIGEVMVDHPWNTNEILVVMLLCTVRAVLMFPYGQGLATAVSLSTSLSSNDKPEPTRTRIIADASWITAAYPLTCGAFALVGPRVGGRFGHKVVIQAALVWWTAFQVGGGFSKSIAVMCVLRGCAGIGAGFVVSNVDALQATAMLSGRKAIMASCLSGAMTLVGTSVGCLMSALLVQLTHWKWSFIMPAYLGGSLSVLVWLTFPSDDRGSQRGQIDWIGAYLGIGGMVLFGFVWISAPGVGWSTPYIYCLLLVALGHFVSFGLWEARLAPEPLVPAQSFKPRHFLRRLMVLACSSLSLAIFFWYFSLFGLEVRGCSTIENGANYQPITVLAVPAAIATVWLDSRTSTKYLISASSFGLVVGNILLATASKNLTYWASMFLAVSSVALSQSASQGLWLHGMEPSDGIFGMVLTYSLGLGIGIAGTVEHYSNSDLLTAYRCALILAVALAGIACVSSLVVMGDEKRTKDGGLEPLERITTAAYESPSAGLSLPR